MYDVAALRARGRAVSAAIVLIFVAQRGAAQSSRDILVANVEEWNYEPFDALRAKGISAYGSGDLGVWGIFVPKHQAFRAYRLLLDDSKRHQTWLSILNPRGHWETHFKKNRSAYDAWIKALSRQSGSASKRRKA